MDTSNFFWNVNFKFICVFWREQKTYYDVISPAVLLYLAMLVFRVPTFSPSEWKNFKKLIQPVGKNVGS